jgi:hypothetical protein
MARTPCHVVSQEEVKVKVKNVDAHADERPARIEEAIVYRSLGDRSRWHLAL